VLTIAASFEREPLEKRNGDTLDAKRVDGIRNPEIHLEAAGLLRRRNREDHPVRPQRLARRRIDQQVRNGPALPVDEAQVAEAVLGNRGFTVVRDVKRLTCLEQRRVSREPLWPGAGRLDGSLARKARQLLLLRPSSDHRESARQRDDRQSRDLLPHAVSFGLDRTNFCNTRVTSTSESASPVSEATKYSPRKDRRS
jgi:hypothetical protein